MTLKEWAGTELGTNELFLMEFADLLDCEVVASNFLHKEYDPYFETPAGYLVCAFSQFGVDMWARIKTHSHFGR